jgi:hypothetical protein
VLLVDSLADLCRGSVVCGPKADASRLRGKRLFIEFIEDAAEPLLLLLLMLLVFEFIGAEFADE